MQSRNNNNYKDKIVLHGYTTMFLAITFIYFVVMFVGLLVIYFYLGKEAFLSPHNLWKIKWTSIIIFIVCCILIPIFMNEKVPIGHIGTYVLNGSVIDGFLLLPGIHYADSMMQIEIGYDDEQIRTSQLKIQNIMCSNNIPVEVLVDFEWYVSDIFKVKSTLNSNLDQIWKNSIHKTITHLIAENGYTDLELISSKITAQLRICDELNEVSQRFGRSVNNVVMNIVILNKARVTELGNVKNIDLVIEQITKIKAQGVPVEEAIKQVFINRGLIKANESIYNVSGVTDLLKRFK